MTTENISRPNKSSAKPKAGKKAPGKTVTNSTPKQISDIAAKIANKPERKITGRPPRYTDDLAKEFCRRIAMGRSLRSVCEDKDMPDSSTVFEWKKKQEGFAEQYAYATEERGLSYGDFISDLVFDVLNGDYEVDRARLALDGLKWTAARLAPKQYGERTSVDVTADIGATAATVLMQLTERAKAAKQLEHNVIDVTPQRFADTLPPK
jgi:hypothetical protein